MASADELLGAPTADDLLGPPVDRFGIPFGSPDLDIPASGPQWDALMQASPIGRVLDAFGHGMKDGWGAGPLGLDETTEATLKSAGILPDYEKGRAGIFRAFNEAMIRPAAAGLDAVLRAGGAALRGGQALVAQTGAELGAPALGRDLAAIPEAFFGSPGGFGPHAPLELARDLKVIGAGEAGWKGTAPETFSLSARGVAHDQLEPIKGVVREAQETAPAEPPPVEAPPAAPEVPPEPAPPADVHGLARQIDPATFAEFDAEQRQIDTARAELAQRTEAAQAEFEAKAPGAAEIADLEARLADTTPRLAKKYEARLAELRPAHDAYLRDHAPAETPEMGSLRALIQQSDYRRRDLSPAVTAAYREAAGQFPVAEEIPPELPPRAAPAAAVPIEAPTPAGGAEPPVAPPAPAEPAIQMPTPAAEPATLPPSAKGQEINGYTTAKGSTYTVHEDGTTTRDKAARADAGHEGDFGIKPRTERTVYVDDARLASALSAAGLSGIGSRGARLIVENNKASLLMWNERAGRWGVSPLSRDISISDAPAIGKAPLELWGRKDDVPGVEAYSRQHAGNVITEIRHAARNNETAPPTMPVPAEPAIQMPAPAGSPQQPAAERSNSQQSAAAPAPADIRTDVTRKLIAAGRPAEEAAAAAEITTAHYEARAARFAGAKGTAAELYAKEGPDITGAKGSPKGPSGKAVIRDGRTVITLFAKADASTFLHETGHHWLEELLRDAVDEAAPDGIRADAAVVKRWLGMDDGSNLPTTRQHERFARGFEQYMLQGTAPSTRLAAVFAQFKSWLQAIYQKVQQLGRPIQDDVRGMFDRMLTADEPTAIVAEKAAQDPVSISATSPEGAKIDKNALQHLPLDQASPYVRVPKPPQRLSGFLRQGTTEGAGMAKKFVRGVRDPRGDVAAIIGDAKGLPGLINNATGMTLDDAALFAHERGYFPEFSKEDRPDINRLLDALKEDVSGNPQYSHHDLEAVQAHDAAMAHNAEIDRLASEHGIRTGALSATEFFDEVARKSEPHQVAEAITAATEQHADTFDGFAAEARGAVEDAGEHWNADEFYGIHGPRTLHELEAEYQREAPHEDGPLPTAGSVEQGAHRGEQGRPADGPPADGEGSAGPRGGGARPASGAGSTESPAGPHERFGPSGDGLIDKAGNIRLDNLNTPEDVNRAIREAAEANNDFIDARRGVVTDSQVIDLADALGMTPQSLDARRIGQAFNAEQVVAARKLLIQSATAVRDAMVRAAEGSDADVMAYATAKAEHAMIQEHVAGITAEAGRALRAFRMLGEDSANVQGVAEFLHANTGRTLFQLRREAKLGAQLDTPAQVSKFIRDSSKPTFIDMLVEFWINSLLSGPMTHVANMLGNGIVAATSILETGIAGGVSKLREAFGAEPGVQLGEAKGRLFGLLRGATDGLTVAAKVFRDEDFQHAGRQVEQRNFRAIPSANIGGLEIGGRQLRIPSRLLGAEDEFFKAIAYRQEINAQAYRLAAQEGLDGMARNQRIAELVTDPPEAMMKTAAEAATVQTFTNSLGDTGRALQSFANSHVLAKMLVPFIRTPVNIAKYALLRSPLGLLSADVRANLMGHNGAAAVDTQIARLGMGTAIGAAVFGMASQGMVTGAGPTDPKEMALWRLTGKQPYSLRVGDTWYSLRRLDPFAFLFAVAADAQQLGAQIGEKSAEKLAGQFVLSVGKTMLEGVGMRGLAEAVRAYENPDRYGDRWATGLAASFYPMGGAAGQAARAIDPYSRDARSLVDQLKARTPWLSQTLLPRYDIFGQPIPSREALGPDGVSPIYESRVNNDPTIQAMMKAQFFPAPVERKIRGVDLTDQQYADFARTAGRMAKMRLDAIVAIPGFAALPVGAQQKVMRETVADSREAARTLILMQSPNIISQARDDKMSLLTTGKKAAK